jgi:predicted DNA-binding protein YlxM (UPF0122 family)
MQNEVINSDISKLFDFDKIDMKVVCENTYKSMLNIVCDFYNVHGYISPDEIAKHFDISRPTIIKYLKLGEKFGICNYTVKLSHIEASRKRGINRRKSVLQYTLDNEFIAEYSCCEEAGAVYNVSRSAISAAARNEINSSCGYIWKYKEGE